MRSPWWSPKRLAAFPLAHGGRMIRRIDSDRLGQHPDGVLQTIHQGTGDHLAIPNACLRGPAGRASPVLSNLGRNVRSLVWALVLGLSVWIAAVTDGGPRRGPGAAGPGAARGRGSEPGLVTTVGDVPEEVRLTIRAPQSVWDQLNARSRKRSGRPGPFGRHGRRASPGATDPDRCAPRPGCHGESVLLHHPTLEPLISRSLACRRPYQVSQPLAISRVIWDSIPQEVLISGPASRVSLGYESSAWLSTCNGIRESIDQDYPVQALDQNNADSRGREHPTRGRYMYRFRSFGRAAFATWR